MPGPLCASCEDHYSISSSFECEACWSKQILILVGSAAMLVAFIGVGCLARKSVATAESAEACGNRKSNVVPLAMTGISMVQVMT